MKVICEGYDKCDDKKCRHKNVHDYHETDDTLSCSYQCCNKFPYHCSVDSYKKHIKKIRKLKIDNISKL